MSFKLLKEIVVPGITVAVGTVGYRKPYSEMVVFGTAPQAMEYSFDYMLKYPDFFKYEGVSKWTDADMLDFAYNYCQTNEALSFEEVEKEFKIFTKKRTE